MIHGEAEHAVRDAEADEREEQIGRLRDEVGEVRWGWNTPQWITAAQMGGFRVSGQLLEQVGLQLPPLWPLEAIVLEVEAL